MKKAYNEAWVLGKKIQMQAVAWQRHGLLDAEQVARIRAAFPENFYRANVWVKVALFLFTLLLNGCATTLTGGFFVGVAGESLVAGGVLAVLYGVGVFFVLENLIASRRLFHSGIDNAMLYTMVIFLNGGIHLMLSSLLDTRIHLYALTALPILIWATVRYASRFLAFSAFLALFIGVGGLFFAVPWGRLVLPFVAMLLAGGVYAFVQSIARREGVFYWHSCLAQLEVAALVVFYAGGNYYVVREGNAAIAELPYSVQIAFAPLFYAFTAGIPVVYVVGGLLRRHRPLLLVGLLAAAASVVTFQHYFSPLSWAVFSVLSGGLLVAGAWLLSHYLREPKNGFASGQDAPAGGLDLEAASLSTQVPTPTDVQPPLFGGGSFGGAGSGGGY